MSNNQYQNKPDHKMQPQDRQSFDKDREQKMRTEEEQKKKQADQSNR